MNRRFFLAATVAALTLVPFAALADLESQMVRRLRKDGYSQITVSRTLLGRMRIVAFGHGGMREIILNPQTGEVLRDVWIASDGSSGPAALANDDTGSDGGGSGGGGSDDDDDPDDDSGDDDSDDENDDSEDDDDGGDDDGED